MAWFKRFWQYVVMAILGLVVVGMIIGNVTSKAPASQQLSQVQQPATPPCPPGFDCTPQKTAVEKQLEALRAEIAALNKQPAAPQAKADAPVSAPATVTTASLRGSDPSVRYTGKTCTRVAKHSGESTVGFEGFSPRGQLGCWKF